MSARRIDSVRSLKDYLNSVINESLKSKLQAQAITEEEVQDSMSGSSDAESEDDDDETILKKGDVKVEDIIEKLNTIRSGRSFKDKKIEETMQRYIKSLERPEQVALLAFLKAIAQIVTAETPAGSVIDPSEFPASIQMKKTSSGKTIVVKPVIKTNPAVEKQKSTGEDTSGPAPIKPKK